MQDREQSEHLWIVAVLLGVGIAARLVPHPWNATPTMAIALFGGTYLTKRWSIALPLLLVAVSDLFLGWHSTIPFTWSAFAATGMLGWWVRRRPTSGRIVTSALAGAVLFFLVSNFGVWATQALYPHTAQGLWTCYLAGVPFFRGTLLGDAVFTAVLFGGYAAVTAALPTRAAAR